jgi:hypothetical protein
MRIKKLIHKLTCLGEYLFYVGTIFFFFDIFIFHNLFGYGYPRHYKEENIQRYPAPYVMFTGKPNVEDHNKLGFRGKSFEECSPESFKIAFFGGSTGYNGEPPIAEILENELTNLIETKVCVANFSVVSSNHRQHLHGILEYLPQAKPDLVLFYGGYNENVSAGYFDPRPGYTYNYFYRAETPTISKFFMEHSALIGEFDKKFGIITGIKKIRDKEQPFSESWNNRITAKYFDTLQLASQISSSLLSVHCGTTQFLAFYQPYIVPSQFLTAHEKIRKFIRGIPYIFDVSSEYDELGKDTVFTDPVHVNQTARGRMGKKLAEIVSNELAQGTLSNTCFLHSN